MDDLSRLRRFVCLGAETATYSVTDARTLALDNAQALQRLLQGGRGEEAVAELARLSTEGRVAKQGALLFALAMCARLGSETTRRAAYAQLEAMCRTPTQLFMFIGYCKALSAGRGWGRGPRRAIGQWYTNKSAKELAGLVTKYKNREGWSHKDVLRLVHAKTADPAGNLVLRYAARGWEAVEGGQAVDQAEAAPTVAFLQAVERAKDAELPEDELVALIATHGLVREHMPTTRLGSVAVWRALLQRMPLTALMRNLAKMTSIGLLAPGTPEEQLVVTKLSDAEALRRARVHPLQVLLAAETYGKGHGERGSLEWLPVPSVVAALDRAFDACFATLKPIGKRMLVALDMSASMSVGSVQGAAALTPKKAAAAMALMLARTEDPANCTVVGFTDRVHPLPHFADATLSTIEGHLVVPTAAIDVAIMLDCTGSMGAHIAACQQYLTQFVGQLSAMFRDAGVRAVRMAFVGYRDIGDQGQYVTVDFTEDAEAVVDVIRRQHASGGGDAPEDVAGALEQVTRLSWQSDNRLLFHIADAPPHGTAFCGAYGDSYPNWPLARPARPCEMDPRVLLGQLAAANTSYVFLSLNNSTATMVQEFRKVYDAPGMRPVMRDEPLRQPKDLLDTLVRVTERILHPTDCAAAIGWALAENRPYDGIIILTDNETTAPGAESPARLLGRYRVAVDLPTKLVSIGMTATDVSIADPADPAMLDVAGFDANVPMIINSFMADEL